MTFGGYPITLIRSARKTFSLSPAPDGGFLLRAPLRASQKQTLDFLRREEKWMKKAAGSAAAIKETVLKEGAIPPEEIERLAGEAARVIPQRVEYYAKIARVEYRKITIRNQTTRWGSCSKNGDLSFNCLLMLAPPEVLDSVVAHELCHIREMNHSKAFYAAVRALFPGYDECQKWLKANGRALIARMKNGQSFSSALASAK